MTPVPFFAFKTAGGFGSRDLIVSFSEVDSGAAGGSIQAHGRWLTTVFMAITGESGVRVDANLAVTLPIPVLLGRASIEC